MLPTKTDEVIRLAAELRTTPPADVLFLACRPASTRAVARACHLAAPAAARQPTEIEISSFKRSRRRCGRVLAVDDHALFLTVLRDVVGATAELEVVGVAQSGEVAIQTAKELKPDMVLMDVRMPGLGGIAAAREIKARRPSTLMILISTTRPDKLPLDAHDTFADAVICKSELDPRLLDDMWLRYRDQTSPSLS